MLAEGDPELVMVWSEAHVVGTEADEDAVEDPPASETDHDQLPAGVIGDVRDSPAGRAPRLRRAEASEDARHPKGARIDEGYRAGTRAHDDGEPVVRLDVFGIRGHVKPADNAPRVEVDGEEQVLRLGGHECDGAPSRRAACEAAGITRSIIRSRARFTPALR